MLCKINGILFEKKRNDVSLLVINSLGPILQRVQIDLKCLPTAKQGAMSIIFSDCFMILRSLLSHILLFIMEYCCCFFYSE